MLIAHFILLVLLIVFKLVHWPGAIIFLMLIILLPPIELLIQLFRKKKDRLRIWSAVAAIGLSVYLAFSIFNWPGHQVLFIFGVAATVPYYFFFIRRKSRPNVRFVLITLLSLLMFVNFSLKDSSRMQLYMLEDPFNNEVPVWTLQQLAFAYYNEGEPAKAEQLLLIGIEHLERVVSKPDEHGIYGASIKAFEENLARMNADLAALQQGNWNYISALYPQDVSEN